MMTAPSALSRLRWSWNRSDKNCGTVMAFRLAEYRRSRRATMSQFSQVPSARPMAVQPGDAMPLRYARPGIPISSQLDISLASALMAVTSGPILRPPR